MKSKFRTFFLVANFYKQTNIMYAYLDHSESIVHMSTPHHTNGICHTHSISHTHFELFVFLTNKVAKATFLPDSLVYVTSGESVLHTDSNNHMPDCSHKEADMRIVVHVLHALQQGVKKIEICTVDTDVIIILMGAFHKLVKTQPVADIWVAFGMEKSYRFLSINAIFDSLDKQKTQALPLFHALTGSHTTSAFKEKGKKSAWQAWQAFAEVTDTFVYLSLYPFESLSVDSIHFKELLFMSPQGCIHKIFSGPVIS